MKPSLALLAFLLAAPAVFAQQPAKSHKKKSAGFQVGGLDLIRKAAALNAGEAPGAPAPGRLLTTDLDGRDLQFLTGAVENGQIQLWLGQQAKEKGEADQVKAIGETLAATQDAENRFVGKLAASKGLPVTPAASAAAQKKIAGQLGGATGAKFDKAVIDQILDTVKQSVASYESVLSSKDPEIKGKLEQLLPMEKEKLTLISRMAGSSQAAGNKPTFRTSAPAAAQEPPKKPTPTPAATPAKPTPKPGPPPPPSPTPIPAKSTPTPATPAASPAATK